MKPGEESKSATVPRLGLKSMILGSDALDQLIITTSQCVARTVPRLSSFPELKVKLASLSVLALPEHSHIGNPHGMLQRQGR